MKIKKIIQKELRLLKEQTSVIYAGHVDIEICNCDNLGASLCSQFMGWGPNQGWNHGHITIDGRTPVVGDRFKSGGPNQYGSTMVTYKVIAVNSYWDANDCGDWNYGTSWSSPGSFNAGGGQACADRNFSNDCGPAPDVECFTCNNNQIDSGFFPNPTGCPSGWNTSPPFDSATCVEDDYIGQNDLNYVDHEINEDVGCLDPAAINYDPTAGPGCVATAAGGPFIPPYGDTSCCIYDIEKRYACVPISTTPNNNQMDEQTTTSFQCVQDPMGPYTTMAACQDNCKTRKEDKGCKDKTASNYNECCDGDPNCVPTIHDKTCCITQPTPEPGCLDPNALNYNECCKDKKDCTPTYPVEKCCTYESGDDSFRCVETGCVSCGGPGCQYPTISDCEKDCGRNTDEPCPNGLITSTHPNWDYCLECKYPSNWPNITGPKCECCVADETGIDPVFTLQEEIRRFKELL